MVGNLKELCKFSRTPCVQRFKSKKVAFSKKVEVHIFHKHKELKCRLPLHKAHIALRNCWSLMESNSLWSECQDMLAHKSNLHVQNPVESVPNSPTVQDHQPLQLIETGKPSDCWNLVSGTDESVRRVRKVETWYLNKGHLEVCKFACSVAILSDMSEDRFEQACRLTWSNVIQPGSIEWFVVRNPPQTSRSQLHI